MLRLLRKVLFWCHLATGVVVAAVVLLMSVTGVLLTYQKQLTRWADTRSLSGAPSSPSDRRLPTDTLVAYASQLVPGASPTAITWRRDPDAPVEIAFGRERTAFVNAYTGEVLGYGSAGMRKFFRVTTELHRWVAMSGEGRATGKAITGAANLGFLFLVLSGFWLWWPRNWTRAAFRNVGAFRRGLSGKARDFNWHHVIGIWSLVPMLVIVASGVVISYPWASALVYRAFGETPPAPSSAPAQPSATGRGAAGGTRGARAGAGSLAVLDDVREEAQRRMPGWRSASVQLPRPGAKSLTLALDAGTGGEPQKRGSLTLDRSTGAVTKWEPFAAGSAARRTRSILRFAHTGEVLGIAGQTLAGLVSLGGAILVWTGLALSWRRFRGWRARTRLAGSPSTDRRSDRVEQRVA